jgi:hypothetical protein
MSTRREQARETAAQLRAAVVSVLVCGMSFAVGGAALFGLRVGLGVAVGGLLATGNLWVFARVAEAFMARKGNTAPWAMVAVLKLVALFGGVAIILRSELVSGVSLAVGYGALPFGITIASLFGPRPKDEEDEEDEPPV